MSTALASCASAHPKSSPTPSRYPVSLIPTTADAARYAAPGYSTSPASPAASSATPIRVPITGQPLWINRNLPAAVQVAAWRTQGNEADAAVLDRIASQPMAIWLTSDTPATLTQLKQVTETADAMRQLPTLVLYNMVDRDCSGFSSGGAASDQAYKSWIDAIVSALGDRRAIVILEPDAVADVVAGCAAAHAAERFALLRYAVTALEQHLGISVYLDAGTPGFPSNMQALVSALKQSGVDAAQGVSLNVSNFYTVASVTSYGDRLSSALGGAHFVIDTSRNGAGPLPPHSGYAGPAWCNPPGRKLGNPPTTTTGRAEIDAYLWIKTPGASDGACGVGDPPAGKWWLTYAMALATP